MANLTNIPLVALREVHKQFGHSVILNGVSLEIFAGEAVAVIGPSGTGKSTLLRLICGLIQPDKGEVLLKGAPQRDAVGGRDDLAIGMVFQQAALFDSLTVAENVGFVLYERSRLSDQEIRHQVREKLRLVGLDDVSDRYPSELSGGMRKRVSLARAILDTPNSCEGCQKILLYDEPTAGLDPVASTVVEDLMRSLKECGACDGYVVVTHQESTIRRTADRLVMLYQGLVRYSGSVASIDETDDPHIRQFFSGSTEGPIQLIGKEV
ncbi:MAG: ATP-binding cassette domain-containing protein [Oscillatoriales cyanobacterium SM2_2_1]|nr:ATP-binding cassette domain-containing protein [Oscillatoriales cyanobacterium SM2_2_1]